MKKQQVMSVRIGRGSVPVQLIQLSINNVNNEAPPTQCLERKKERETDRQKCPLVIANQHHKLAVQKLIPIMVASVQL